MFYISSYIPVAYVGDISILIFGLIFSFLVIIVVMSVILVAMARILIFIIFLFTFLCPN